MFRKFSVVFLIVAMLFMIGCAAHVHKVGQGAQGNDITNARQWYVLWGLVPINTVDTNVMAAGAADYEITTALTPLDVIISAVLGQVTVYCRTVTVQK